jgi:hypothetical protein
MELLVGRHLDLIRVAEKRGVDVPLVKSNLVLLWVSLLEPALIELFFFAHGVSWYHGLVVGCEGMRRVVRFQKTWDTTLVMRKLVADGE